MDGPRAAAELAQMTWALGTSRAESQPRNGIAVMVVPGIGGSDTYTRWLRRYLNDQGFSVEGWGLGLNTGGKGLVGEVDFFDIPDAASHPRELEVPMLSIKLREHLRQRVATAGQPYMLVGHSLGGYLAREVSRQAPELVCNLVTMGSPVYGGPKYTAMASVFKKIGVDVDWIEALIAEREKIPLQMPVTTIVSAKDGVVGYQASIDRHQPHARHIEVDASHCGMAFNVEVWNEVVNALNIDVN